MRIVIKVGTSTLTHKTGWLNIKRVEQLCRVISDLKNAGNEIVIVSSGAIGMGVGKLSLNERPKDIPTKQAAAAVGQCELMYTYDKLFSEYHHTVAQILLTASDINCEERQRNVHNTLMKLLELSVIPIINENDSVATEEISVGDNDTLAALTAVNVEADLLVILTDIDGFYTADPKTHPEAHIISEINRIDETVWAAAGKKGSELAVGGMETKLHAAQIVTSAGTDMIIANGNNPEILYSITEGKRVGTKFISSK